MFWSFCFHSTVLPSTAATFGLSKPAMKLPYQQTPSEPENLHQRGAARNLAGRHEEPRQRDIDDRVTDSRVRPVDDDGTRRTDDNVERVQIEMHDARAGAKFGRSEEIRGWQLMEPAMEVRERPPLTLDGPRRPRDGVDHRRANDPLHNELGSVLADLIDGGYGVSLCSDVLHGPSLGEHRPPLARAAQNQTRAVLEDVGVTPRSEQGPGLTHSDIVEVLKKRFSISAVAVARACLDWYIAESDREIRSSTVAPGPPQAIPRLAKTCAVTPGR